jgi:hypothetical protein
LIGRKKLRPVGAKGREELTDGGVDWQDKVRPVGAEGKEELMARRS